MDPYHFSGCVERVFLEPFPHLIRALRLDDQERSNLIPLRGTRVGAKDRPYRLCCQSGISSTAHLVIDEQRPGLTDEPRGGEPRVLLEMLHRVFLALCARVRVVASDEQEVFLGDGGC